MWTLLPLPYRIGAILLVLVGIFGSGYFMGYRGEHDKLVTYEAKVQQAADDQLAHTKQVEADHKTLQENTKNDYEKRLADVNAYWTQRLLHATPSSFGLSKPGPTTGGAVKAATDALPDPLQLIKDCADTTVQLEALQTWVMTEIMQSQ